MPSDDAWTGRVLGDRYEIVGVLGRGGMASVYRAQDRRLDRFVAVKIFAGDVASADDDRQRAEVDALAKLNHPNLVTLHDAHLDAAGTEPTYLIMELVDGPDLRTTLDHGPLLGEIVAAITTDIAEALVTVHSLGLVHRDVKPANILLQPTGLPTPRFRAKLADFGIAHLLGADRLTAAGMVVGTAAYLSPEQATGAEIGPAADVYALGLVILEGLTGRRVYPGSLVEAMTARAALDPVVPDDLPPEWVTLLTWMTARDPEDRPTAMEVAVRSREIGALLAGWAVPEVAAAADDATQALLAPTKVITAGEIPLTRSTTVLAAPARPTQESGSGETAQASTSRDRSRRLAGIVAITVLVLAIGSTLLVLRLDADDGQATPSTPTSVTPSPSTTSSVSPSPAPSTPVVSTVAPVVPQPGNGNGNGKEKGNGKVKNK